MLRRNSAADYNEEHDFRKTRTFAEFIRRIFNRREFEKILSMMQPDVKWANGMEGGFVYGRDAVRDYWRKQFKVVRAQIEPLRFEIDYRNRARHDRSYKD